MKITKVTLLLFLLIKSSTLLYSQNWLWAKRNIIGNDADFSTAVCNDKHGNVIVSALTTSSVYIAGNDTVLNNSTDCNILTKLDSTGNFLWTKKIGNNSVLQIESIATNDSGNIFVAGVFSNTLILENDTLASTGGGDIFLLKLSNDGSLVWSKKFGNLNGDVPSSICVDKAGSIIVTGYTYSNLLVFDQDTLHYNEPKRGFIVKINSLGNVDWARKLATEKITSVKTDSNNNVYLAGTFFGTIIVGTNTLTSSQSGCYSSCNKSFLAKYDSNGNGEWGKSSEEKGCQGTAICVDIFDKIYLTGYSNWGATTFDSVVVMNVLPPHTYLVKFNSDGKALWGKASQGYYHLPNSITCDSNIIYLSGAGNYPIAFNNDTVKSTLSLGSYIYRFDLDGNSLCSSPIICPVKVSADYFNHAYIVGGFNSDFLVLGEDTFATKIGHSDAFVAKLLCNASLPVITTDLDVNFEDKNFNLHFNLFPNPNDGAFNFRSDKALVDGFLLVFNAFGQQIWKQKISKGDNLVQIGFVAKGAYYFKVIAANQNDYNGKFIVR